MLARALIVVASTFSLLLSLISVDAQDHVVKNHFRRKADKSTSSTSSPQRRSTLTGTLLANGNDDHGNESFLHGTLNGVPPYNACGPSDGPIPPSAPGDAPFTQGRFAYEKKISCPHGIRNSPKGILLMVPCTTCDAAQTYTKSPFGIGLPQAGFDLCYVDLPWRSLGDIQLSAEFIAYAILYLAQRSPATGYRISLFSYSQGGYNAQWALTFFRSARQKVFNSVAMAAVFKGTTFTAVGCVPSALMGGCEKSLLQMSPNSKAIRALTCGRDRESGAFAHVPTTSIFTAQDDLVVPQSDSPSGVSFLPGASNMLIQKVCPGTVVDHFGLPVNMVAYGIAFDAFTNGRPSTQATFDRRFCGHYLNDLLAFAGGIPNYVELLMRALVNPQARVGMLLKEVTTLTTTGEPKLQQYVCDRGYAPQQDCTVGFCGPEQRQDLVTGLLGDTALGGAIAKHGNPWGPLLGTAAGPLQGGPLQGLTHLLG